MKAGVGLTGGWGVGEDGGEDQPFWLDACWLNGPSDDQRQDRIRLEAEAVLLILGRCEAGTWQWLSSAVVEKSEPYAQ